jgi:hypothetical protein
MEHVDWILLFAEIHRDEDKTPVILTAISVGRGADSDSQVGDNYGERSEPKKFFCSRGIIHPETAKLTMLE